MVSANISYTFKCPWTSDLKRIGNLTFISEYLYISANGKRQQREGIDCV